ncbi:unnamed protein product [Boreogadus saida]
MRNQLLAAGREYIKANQESDSGRGRHATERIQTNSTAFNGSNQISCFQSGDALPSFKDISGIPQGGDYRHQKEMSKNTTTSRNDTLLHNAMPAV